MTEQEELELREQAETGRKAKIALEFLDYFLTLKRAVRLNEIETSKDISYETLLAQKISLMELKEFENWLKSNIDNGEIAEKELNENGK